MQTIYIVTEYHDGTNFIHHTVYSNFDDAYNRVQFLLKEYSSNIQNHFKWYCYYTTQTHVRRDVITIEQFNYLPGHDEWVNVN